MNNDAITLYNSKQPGIYAAPIVRYFLSLSYMLFSCKIRFRVGIIT
jgi:hypothetical protein